MGGQGAQVAESLRAMQLAVQSGRILEVGRPRRGSCRRAETLFEQLHKRYVLII